MYKILTLLFIILLCYCGSNKSINPNSGPDYYLSDSVFITELVNSNSIALDSLDNRITTITSQGKDRIKTMDLSNLELEILPENINDLEYLEELDLSNNLFSNFPEELCSVHSKINAIFIENNNLCDPTEITHCVLEEITVDFNKQNCSIIKDTQEMDFLLKFIRENGLDSISTTIFDNIVWSWIGTDSALTADGKQIERITSIRWINHNIDQIPSDIKDLEYLKKLELEDNMLKNLPAEIKFLERLSDLQLQNNILDALPDKIGNIYNLEELNVSGNNLTILPETIGALNNLTFLNVGNNQLITLPDTLCGLISSGLSINIECNELDSALVNSCFYNELGSQGDHPNCTGN